METLLLLNSSPLMIVMRMMMMMITMMTMVIMMMMTMITIVRTGPWPCPQSVPNLTWRRTREPHLRPHTIKPTPLQPLDHTHIHTRLHIQAYTYTLTIQHQIPLREITPHNQHNHNHNPHNHYFTPTTHLPIKPPQ